ncbi:putative hydrolase or acyltransferase of alpha/beta superfamily [Thermoplasmatales archaeon SCGC AB-539-C06]|nr:putative hydrolase or acyltransferase of alpha/beta superfamily [Thermoplasmatales archaeon SCGC AB-539-C06]
MSFAKINNVEINYHTVGDGQPLLFVAGLGVDNMCWIYQVPKFQEFFKVIVFDNRGIGKSTGSIAPYSIRMMADDAVELLKYLNIEKSHIAGTSMGGMIAQEIAINYPDMVDKLVLCSTFAKPQNMVEIIMKGVKDIIGYNALDIFGINPHRLVFEKLFSYLLEQIFSEEFLLENKKLIEEILRKYLSRLTYVETFLKQTGAVYTHNTIDRLNMVKAETLIITGMEDKLVVPECSDILAEKISRSKLEKIDNAGHGMHFEMPDIFNKIVIDFLSEKKE